MKILTIDKFSGVPIYEQIMEQILRLIASGNLRPGDQIPSVRSLSLELSINPNTIQKAYNELELRKITASVPGVGRFVSENAKASLLEQSRKKIGTLQDIVCDLAVAGIPEEEIVQVVRIIYEKLAKEKRNQTGD